MPDNGPPMKTTSASGTVIVRILLGVGFAIGASSLGAVAGRLAHSVPTVPVDDVPMSLAAAGLRNEWRLKLGRHWQITSNPSESQETTDATEGTRGSARRGWLR